MKTHKRKIFLFFLVLSIGIIAGALIQKYLTNHVMADTSSNTEGNKAEPLYWVAPMDANYKRDKPGLSPMGMDLVPVYNTATTESDAGPGVIKISANVINNLGVRTADVIYQPLEQTLNVFGVIKYNENRLIHIHPRVEGWIEKLHVTAKGDPVKKGDPLYELYSPELVNAQQEFIAEQNSSQGNLSQASKIRLKALNISQAFIEKLKHTKKIQQTVTFYAPQNGVIDHLNIREGFFVKPDTTLMSIGNLDKVWIEAEVFPAQVRYVKLNQAVTFTMDYFPEKNWLGKIDYIYPELNEINRTLRVRVELDNNNNLLQPNMYGNVNINVGNNLKRLQVPNQAIVKIADHNKVVVALGNGQFKSVAVKTGIVGHKYTEIIAGLSEHEQVVERGLFLLDSESSKDSDFKRISHPLSLTAKNITTTDLATTDMPTARVNGVIKRIELKDRTIFIAREKIEKWNRDKADVLFSTDQHINLKTLNLGDDIDFTFVINNGDFIITKIHTRPITKDH
jgi:Cu(I)/Ag(I) efflux system membrane fusion protein